MRFVDYERIIEVRASTLGEALAQVESRYPKLSPVLRDGNGQLSRANKIIINGELASSVDLNTPQGDTDDVEFLDAMAGR